MLFLSPESLLTATDMSPTDQRGPRKTLLMASFLWTISVLLTLFCFTFQDRTGPTYPLEGVVHTPRGDVHFKFLRSETIGNALDVLLVEPVPEGLSAVVEYRRARSSDRWTSLSFAPGTFEFSRRGRTETVRGLGARLPSLSEPAGKYEYFVYLDAGTGEKISATAETPVVARYKGAVPTGVLILHILVIFASMTFACRTVLEAIVNGEFHWMLWVTVCSLLAGAFFLGPLVQQYAFGVWWSGVPYGHDWTDNKVLIELAFWIVALLLNRGSRRHRASIYAAGIITLLVYLIPHSVFGSEFDYTKGAGSRETSSLLSSPVLFSSERCFRGF